VRKASTRAALVAADPGAHSRTTRAAQNPGCPRVRVLSSIAALVVALAPWMSLQAAVFSSTQDGPWASTATWGGAGVPENGDTVSIMHAVTASSSVTVGASPGTSAAIAAVRLDGGTLTIGPGVTFVARGDVRVHPGYLVLEAGAILELDSSQAASPATSVYAVDVQPTSGGNALLSVNGTATARCQIRSNPAGAHARISDGNGTLDGGRMIASYCDFVRLGGDPDYRAWVYRPTGDGDLFRIQDCTWTQCSQVGARYGEPAGAHVELIRSIWRDSVINPGGNDYWEIFVTGAEYGAINKVIGCDFDKRIYLGMPRDYEIEDCVFREGVKSYSGDWRQGTLKSFKRNLVRWLQDGTEWSVTFGSTIEDNVFVKDGAFWNPHYIGIDGGTGALSIRGNVVWMTGAIENEGDVWMMGYPASGTRAENTITFERNIYLPNGLGPDGVNNISGTGFTILVGDDPVLGPTKQVVFKRNTVFAGAGAGGCNVGETQTAFAGDVAYFKSNLFLGTLDETETRVGRKLSNLGHAETDVVLAENADYNGSYRLRDGTNYGNGSGKGYNDLSFSGSAVIGAHDVDDVDPQFVDPTRTPATWDASLGGPGTLQGAMDRLSPGGGSSMEDLLVYVRQGFWPQNPAYQAGGDPADGSPPIGAVDPPAMMEISIQDGSGSEGNGAPSTLTLGVSIAPPGGGGGPSPRGD